MVLLFSRTVDLLTAFAPATLFGYAGMETFYGLAVGLLVEGALFAMKLTLGRAKNPIDWIWNVVVIIAPFLVSALAQVFDSFNVRNTMIQQPEYIQVFVQWFIPSIPTVIIGLLIGKSIFATMPASIMPKGMPLSQAMQSKHEHGKTPVVGRVVFHLPKFLQHKGHKSTNPMPSEQAKDQVKVNPQVGQQQKRG